MEAAATDFEDDRACVSVINGVSGNEIAYLEDVDPATTTVADVKTAIHEQHADIAIAELGGWEVEC